MPYVSSPFRIAGSLISFYSRPEEAATNPDDPREARTCIPTAEFWLLNFSSSAQALQPADLLQQVQTT
jgi:hypothetical protein